MPTFPERFSFFRHKKEHAPHPEWREFMRESLERQYWRQVQLLNVAHVLEPLPELGGFGIRDAEARPYLLPTFETIWQLCEKNWPLVKKKSLGGFTELQLTPIACSIKQLKKMTERELIRQFQIGNLSYLSYHNLRCEARLSIREPIHHAMPSAMLSYFPEKLSELGHAGLTKKQVVEASQQTDTPGWHVCVVEAEEQPLLKSLRNLMTKKKWVRNRRLKEVPYNTESGTIIEDVLTHFLLQLTATGQVSNVHWKSLCTGNFQPSVELHPTVSFSLTAGQLLIDYQYAHVHYQDTQSRIVVRLA